MARAFCHLRRDSDVTHVATHDTVELRGFEPLTFCMPCRPRKSDTVGQSRSGSPSPVQTIRVGRGESASVYHVGSRPWLPRPLLGEGLTMIEITDECMSLKVEDKFIATARFTQHAAGDGNGAWIVSTHPARLFSRNEAITALTVAELGETGNSDSHPLMVALQEELR